MVCTLCAADDQVLISQDSGDIKYMTRKVMEEYHKWGLGVNVDETKCMCDGGGERN